MEKRFKNIDMLKGIAVILMSITHVNSLFFENPHGILDSLTWLGATVCFVIFLFVSGFLYGKKASQKKKGNWKKIGKKILNLYLAYLFLGILSTLVLEKTLSFDTVLNIIVLNKLPWLTEFLVALIWFDILAKLLEKYIQKALEKPLLLFILSILLYVLGMVLYKVEIGNTIIVWFKMHLVGNLDVHLFPILEYTPVFVLGLISGRYGGKKLYLTSLSISFFTILILYYLNLSSWYRWPPSIVFLLYGIFSIFVLLYIFEFVKKWKSLCIITYLGRYSLKFLVILTTISLLSTIFLTSSSNVLIVGAINMGILVISWGFGRMLE